jgi:hypothetical protein
VAGSNVNHVERTSDGAAVASAATVFYVHASEIAGSPAAAEVAIYDAASASGTPVLRIKLTASDSKTLVFGPNGIRFNTAVYVKLASGAAHVSVGVG